MAGHNKPSYGSAGWKWPKYSGVKRVNLAATSSPIQRSMIDVLMSNWSLDANPMLAMFEMMSRVKLGIRPGCDRLRTWLPGRMMSSTHNPDVPNDELVVAKPE